MSKPSKPVARKRYTQLTVREVSGVDIPAQEGADVVFTKRRDLAKVLIAKAAALTSADAGHQHLLCGIDEHVAGETDGAYMSMGADGYGMGWHRHAWIRLADGTYQIALCCDHTHTLTGPGAVAEAETADPADMAGDTADAMKRGTPTITRITVTPTPTPAGAGVTTTTVTTAKTQEHTTMAMTPEELARLNRAEALAQMSDTEKRYLRTLEKRGDGSAATFVAKSGADRLAEIDADKVVHVVKHGALAGREFRASEKAADPDKVAMAIELDAQAERAITAEKRARQVETRKAAESLGGIGGTLDERVDLLEVIEAGAAALGLSVEKAARVGELINGASDLIARAATKMRGGFGGDSAPAGSPIAVFKAKLAKFAAEKNTTEVLATSAFMKTDEGREAYAEAYPLS